MPMLLNRTPVLDVHYDTPSHVLRVVWPDIKEAERWEIEWSIGQLRTMIKGFYISKMLVDASQTTQLLSLDTLLTVWTQITDLVLGTGLRKIARVRSRNPAREALAQEAYQRFRPEVKCPDLEYRQFNTEEEAMKWLQEG
jgi:hypothetical protein